jgi:carbamoyltransferase
MIVLGINAYHGDASACIVYNDKVIAAAEEERFNRIKHSAGFPFQAIKFCLQFSNLNLDQIDYVTINRDPKQKFLKKLLFATRNLFKLKFYKDRIDNLKKINSIKHQLESFFEQKFNGKVVNIDHHTSHIASSVFFSNYKKTNFISVDGFGDFTSTVIGHYDGETLIRFDETLFPHSLGIFYTAITQFLGFNNYGEEYKVMGLAPYGEPKFESKIRNLIISKDKGLFNLDLKYFLHHTGDVEMTWMDGEPKIGKIYSEHLVNLLGPERKAGEDVKKFHMDIASSVQKVYEDMFIEIVNKLYNFNNCDSLSISGGCGMNSVANGKILKKTNYKNVYLPSSPGDSGGAIGSAVFYINKHKNFRFFDDNPFKGLNILPQILKKFFMKKNLN